MLLKSRTTRVSQILYYFFCNYFILGFNIAIYFIYKKIYLVIEYSDKMLFHPHILEDLSDKDNDYGEDEEEEDDGGDSDFDAKEASRGRQATAKRKRAAGITNTNSFISDTFDGVSNFL